MSNVTDRQITIEGRRNVVVKFTGILDTSNVSLSPAFSILDCANNDVRQVLKGFRVDLLEWSIAAPLEVQLYWNGSTSQQIFPLAGRGKIAGWNYGGFIPDMNRTGYDGSINLVTTGYNPGTILNYVVVLELVKLYSV